MRRRMMYGGKLQEYTLTTDQGNPDVYVENVWVGKCTNGVLKWKAKPYEKAMNIYIKNYEIDDRIYPEDVVVEYMTYSTEFSNGDTLYVKTRLNSPYNISATGIFSAYKRKNVTSEYLWIGSTNVQINYIYTLHRTHSIEYPTGTRLIDRSLPAGWTIDESYPGFFQLITGGNEGERARFNYELTFPTLGKIELTFYIETRNP